MRRFLFTIICLLLFCATAVEAELPPPTGVTASVDSCWGIHISWDALAGADSSGGIPKTANRDEAPQGSGPMWPRSCRMWRPASPRVRSRFSGLRPAVDRFPRDSRAVQEFRWQARARRR